MKIIWNNINLNVSKEFTNLGSDKELLLSLNEFLMEIKEDIVSINMALYLFNNMEIYKTLNSLSNKGVKINVYSIPLDGYDSTKPCQINDYKTGENLGNFTKYDLARLVYNKAYSDNFNLKIFPHIMIRSSYVNPFSRGDMPYSLHCKTIWIECKDTNYIIVTSSNMAVRDLDKINIVSVIQADNQELYNTKLFYKGLEINSIPIREYRLNMDFSHYNITMVEPQEKSELMYTAPFFKYSNIDFEDRLSNIVATAQDRIIVAAQHISAWKYNYNGKQYPGFLTKVLEKIGKVRYIACISQTYSDGNNNSKFRQPQNKQAFIKFISAYKYTIGNRAYFVNNDLHLKIILVDNTTIITTSNLTPTQFLYLPSVVIDRFEKIPNYSYSGIHSEVGVYYIEENKVLSDYIEEKLTDISRNSIEIL